MLRADLSCPVGALDVRVRLEVGAGETLALAGRSGAGKTTVLRALAGLVPATTGAITCGGRTWLDTEAGVAQPAERRDCGFLFQDYALFPTKSALGNVAFGLRGNRARRRAVARAELDRFGLGALETARPRSMSGGERQRVALARTLARRPSALLLDEPLAALDPSSRDESRRQLALTLSELEIPVVLVTHDFVEAATLGSRIAVLESGRIVQEGTAAEISAEPSSDFVARFAGYNVLHGRVEGSAGGLTAVRLDGGGLVHAPEPGDGEVSVVVHPWEITIGMAGDAAASSMNELRGPIETMSSLGPRTRLTLAPPDRLVAEVTTASVERLGLRPGQQVVASWKAAATRLTGQAVRA